MSELKACPFCGREVEAWEGGEWGKITNGVYEGGTMYYAGCDHCVNAKGGHSPEEAAKRWNTRPIEDALRSRVGELEKMWQLEHTEKITLEEKLKHIEQMNEWHKEQWMETPAQPEGDASYWRAKYEEKAKRWEEEKENLIIAIDISNENITLRSRVKELERENKHLVEELKLITSPQDIRHAEWFSMINRVRAVEEKLEESAESQCNYHSKVVELEGELDRLRECLRESDAYGNECDAEIARLRENAAGHEAVMEKIYSALKCDDYTQDPEMLIMALQEENARLREMVRWRNYPEEKPEVADLYWCELLSNRNSTWVGDIAYLPGVGWMTKAKVLRWTFLPQPPEVE